MVKEERRLFKYKGPRCCGIAFYNRWTITRLYMYISRDRIPGFDRRSARRAWRQDALFNRHLKGVLTKVAYVPWLARFSSNKIPTSEKKKKNIVKWNAIIWNWFKGGWREGGYLLPSCLVSQFYNKSSILTILWQPISLYWFIQLQVLYQIYTFLLSRSFLFSVASFIFLKGCVFNCLPVGNYWLGSNILRNRWIDLC